MTNTWNGSNGPGPGRQHLVRAEDQTARRFYFKRRLKCFMRNLLVIIRDKRHRYWTCWRATVTEERRSPLESSSTPQGRKQRTEFIRPTVINLNTYYTYGFLIPTLLIPDLTKDCCWFINERSVTKLLINKAWPRQHTWREVCDINN